MIHQYRLIEMIYRYGKNFVGIPLLVIQIFDVGKSADLPLSENLNDLPISVMRISDIGKSDDFSNISKSK